MKKIKISKAQKAAILMLREHDARRIILRRGLHVSCFYTKSKWNDSIRIDTVYKLDSLGLIESDGAEKSLDHTNYRLTELGKKIEL